MRIGQLAERCSVSADTVRYYEARGLLPEPKRTEAGYRDYGEESVQQVRFIKNAQQIGFGLAEVEGLLALKLAPGSTCEEVHERATDKLRDVEERIGKLQAIRSALDQLIATCQADRIPAEECHLLQLLEEQRL